MSRFSALIVASAMIGFVATEAVSEGSDALKSCFDCAASAEAKYQCFGSMSKECIAGFQGGAAASVVPCVEQEAEAWSGLLEAERAAIAETLATRRIVEGPCTGNEAGCLQGLSNLMADGAAYRKSQCAVEALPENNAERPELALAACRMREISRQAIRVWSFGQGMGRAE